MADRTPPLGTGSSATRDQFLARRLRYRAGRGGRRGRIAGDRAFDAVTGGEAARAAAMILVVTLVLWLIATILIMILVLLLNGGGSSASIGYGGVSPLYRLAGLAEVGLLSLVPLVAAFVAAGLIPERRYAADWGIAVDAGRADGARVIRAIADQIARTQLPVKVEEGLGLGIGGHGSYLRIHDGPYSVAIGAVDMGSTVYVTWSMWRERTRFRVIASFLRHLASAALGRGSEFHQVIRTDGARAMRDGLHDAVRAGVDAALAG